MRRFHLFTPRVDTLEPRIALSDSTTDLPDYPTTGPYPSDVAPPVQDPNAALGEDQYGNLLDPVPGDPPIVPQTLPPNSGIVIPGSPNPGGG